MPKPVWYSAFCCAFCCASTSAILASTPSDIDWSKAPFAFPKPIIPAPVAAVLPLEYCLPASPWAVIRPLASRVGSLGGLLTNLEGVSLATFAAWVSFLA